MKVGSAIIKYFGTWHSYFYE